jgi:hypothetical protein
MLSLDPPILMPTMLFESDCLDPILFSFYRLCSHIELADPDADVSFAGTRLVLMLYMLALEKNWLAATKKIQSDDPTRGAFACAQAPLYGIISEIGRWPFASKTQDSQLETVRCVTPSSSAIACCV